MSYEDRSLGVGWIRARPSGKNRYDDGFYGGRGYDELSADEKYFVDNAARAKHIAESDDPASCYSFDDNALYELDGSFYWFNTSGCSCPSPDEVWDLVMKGTREEIAAKLTPDLADYPSEAHNAFVRAVKAAGWDELGDAPEGRKTDW